MNIFGLPDSTAWVKDSTVVYAKLLDAPVGVKATSFHGPAKS
jgi:hypothetical protein